MGQAASWVKYHPSVATPREELRVSPVAPADAPEVLALYRAVASAPSHGLARETDEIDLAYVTDFLDRAARSGLSLGLRDETGALLGELHASRLGSAQFAHNLADLTIAIHPACQGRGAGTELFAAFIEAARRLVPRVERIELMVRSGHTRAFRLYQRLGFAIEGRFIGRVRLPGGAIEDDIAMALRL